MIFDWMSDDELLANELVIPTHHQPRDQERRIANAPVEHGHVRFEHMREDEQVQQGREHGRENGLEADFPEAQQLFVEQRQPASTKGGDHVQGIAFALMLRVS